MSDMAEFDHDRVCIAFVPLFCALMCVTACNRRDESTNASPPSQQSHETPIAAETIETSLKAAQRYLDAQDAESAYAILQRLIERSPREVRAREAMAQTLLALAKSRAAAHKDSEAKQMRAKAYEEYRIATEIDPASAGLHHSAGMIAMQAELNDAALMHFERAAELDPSNPQFPLFAAQLLIQTEQFEKAERYLRQVLSLDEHEAFAYASLAMIAVEQRRFVAALEHIENARALQPQNLGFRAQHAKIFRRSGQPRQGLELLIGLSESQRAEELIAFEIAACYDLLKEPMKAARTWQHVFQANPTRPTAWKAAVQVGNYLVKAGEREQAVLWLQQAQLAAPDEPDVIALEQLICRSPLPTD